MVGWNCEPEIRKNVQMTPSFVNSVAQAINGLEHMFQTSSGWAAELMICAERCWPFGLRDKLDVILYREGEQYRIRIEGEYGEFWNPDEESQTVFLDILLPKINAQSQFLMSRPNQIFLNILGRAIDGLAEADKDMLRRVMPRLKDGPSFEVDGVLQEVWKLVYDRLNG